MEPFTPEELEQGILAPQQSYLIAELVTKVLLKKANKRRQVPIGEGYAFEAWHEMLTKQISQWYRTYERYERLLKKEDDDMPKMSTAHNIIIRLFEELEGNPFILEESQQENLDHIQEPEAEIAEIKDEPESELVTPGRRTTRLNTNSLPRGRKLRYNDDFIENSSEFEDEEKFHSLGDIPADARVLVIYYLCLYKLESEDELRHEIQYVPIKQLKNEPLGEDSTGNHYYHFYQTDCRIYKQSDSKFELLAKTIEQVKEVIARLENSGS